MDKDEVVIALESINADKIKTSMEVIDEINKHIQNPNIDMARLALHDAEVSLEEAVKAIKEHKND